MAMTVTNQEIAEIVSEIGQNLKRLVAAEVANALFQSTGKIPEEKRTGGRPDLERGPRPPGPPSKD
jgi:hypothetical protein